MDITEQGAAEAAQRIADALAAAGISYAIGGALALAIAGVPRGTADEHDERTQRWDAIAARYGKSR